MIAGKSTEMSLQEVDMRKHWPVGASFVAALTVLGCVSFEGYETLLSTWVGDTEASLVSKWGPPQNLYVSSDGDRTLMYYSNITVIFPGYNSTPPMPLQMTCQTKVTIGQARIVSWRYNGNDCRA